MTPRFVRFADLLVGKCPGNGTINNRTLEKDQGRNPEEFGRMRGRWGRPHALGVVLTGLGFAAPISGAQRTGGER